MEQIIQNLPEYVAIICQILGAVCLVATFIVKITPSKEDDAILQGVRGKFLKFLSYLPTLGINPRTKAIEEALKQAEAEGKTVDVDEA